MTLPDMDVYGEIMQQADASALRLLEALVVTLPETLLQTYVLICTDIGIKSPGTRRPQGRPKKCLLNDSVRESMPHTCCLTITQSLLWLNIKEGSF